MSFNIITIFPKIFKNFKKYGILKKAINKKIIEIKCWNLRKFTKYKRKKIDYRPYGGGPGMIMCASPIKKAIKQIKKKNKKKLKVIYLSPQGKKINTKNLIKILKINKKFILLCGRYEGIDERIIKQEIDEEWSIGDYILTGGELAAMVFIDAISRLIPGVLNKKSFSEESFFNGLLDYPQYTYPRVFNGEKVPKILLSGNHKKIRLWRLKKSLIKTKSKRPDLLKLKKLNSEEKKIIKDI
ncbi:tRNA (guanine-N(1)-)-methyltransferase [Buchnera aphidicola (Drepanosiphum platanoidis)]